MKLIAAALIGLSTGVAPGSLNPATNECVVQGIDTERADPTFSHPDEGEPMGATLFLLCGESDLVDDLYTLRIDADTAQRLADLAEVLAAEPELTD